MPSHRIKQVNELIRNELNKVILKEGELPLGYLATITKVNTSADLSQSKITISILPADKQGTILNLLNNKAKHLQYELGKIIILRKTPVNMAVTGVQPCIFVKIAEVYPPIAKKPACPRDIWPVYPTRIFRPTASITLTMIRFRR